MWVWHTNRAGARAPPPSRTPYIVQYTVGGSLCAPQTSPCAHTSARNAHRVPRHPLSLHLCSPHPVHSQTPYLGPQGTREEEQTPPRIQPPSRVAPGSLFPPTVGGPETRDPLPPPTPPNRNGLAAHPPSPSLTLRPPGPRLPSARRKCRVDPGRRGDREEPESRPARRHS